MGGMDIPAAVQVAHLALKHRRNKNGGQRVFVFVGSPVQCDSKALVKAGRQLKKNNIAVDVILMGGYDNDGNEEKMQELVKAANSSSSDNCHLVSVPPGVLPSDVLVSSPVVHGNAGRADGGLNMGESGAPAAVGAGGQMDSGFGEFGGVDPNMDPELAMALRVSMEEERARQERAAAAANEQKEAESEPAAASAEQKDETGDTNMMDVDKKPSSSEADNFQEQSEEDLLLQQALAMSMNEDNDNDEKPSAENTSKVANEESVEVTEAMEEDDEDAAMQLALQMSMQPDTDEAPQQAQTGQFQDPAFVNQLLGSLPGVDPNDPAIQNALRNFNQQQQEEKDEDADSKDKNEK